MRTFFLEINLIVNFQKNVSYLKEIGYYGIFVASTKQSEFYQNVLISKFTPLIIPRAEA